MTSKRCVYCGADISSAKFSCPNCGGIIFRSDFVAFMLPVILLGVFLFLVFLGEGREWTDRFIVMWCFVIAGVICLTILLLKKKVLELYTRSVIKRLGRDSKALSNEAVRSIRDAEQKYFDQLQSNFQDHIPSPLRTGITYSGLVLGLVAVVVFLLYQSMTPLMWQLVAWVAGGSILVCFGYAYTANKIGIRRARIIFSAMGIVILAVVVYVVVRIAERI